MQKVSILTPCYNSEEYIGRCIDRILKQKYDDVELVFVNDGSTDNTEKIIFEYKKKISKRGYSLIYFKKENGGLGSAINKALKLMTGDFFAWCDSDNFYTDDYILDNIKMFNSVDDCNIVRCDGYIVDEANLNKPIRNFAITNTNKFKENLFLNAIVEYNFHFGCVMLRTEAFDKVNPKREIYESREGQNWQLLLPMFYKYKSYYIDKPMFYFVIRKDSISGQTHNGTLEKKLSQQAEHEKILLDTIGKIKMRKKGFYKKIIKKKYVNRRIELAKKYNDGDLLAKEQRSLKKYKNVTIDIPLNLPYF